MHVSRLPRISALVIFVGPQNVRRSEDLEMETMKYAIVESGGKQYRAVEGGVIDVDRLPVEAGQVVNLDRVLLMVDGDEVTVGAPVITGAEVKATVVEHIQGPKVVIFKYRPKKRYRVKGGHRQQYTRLLIEQVGAHLASAEVAREGQAEQAKAKKEPAAPEPEQASPRAETAKGKKSK